MSKATARKVSDPNAKSNAGLLWGLLVLLVIVAGVIGYIVISGQNAKTDDLAKGAEETSMEVSYVDNVVTLKAPDAGKDAPQVDLYEDTSCPHCAELAEATDGQMKDAIESGKLIVNVHHLNFLDGKDTATNTGHSTQSVAALVPLAQAGDAHAYWNLRKVLFDRQQEVAKQWKPQDFADAAKAYDASSDEVDAVKNADIATGQQIATANYKKLQDATGSVSSPRILKDGKDLEVENLDDWVKVATGEQAK